MTMPHERFRAVARLRDMLVDAVKDEALDPHLKQRAQLLLEIYPTVEELAFLVNDRGVGLPDPPGAAVEEGVQWVQDLRPRASLSENMAAWHRWITRHLPTVDEVKFERDKAREGSQASTLCLPLEDWVSPVDPFTNQPAVRPAAD